MATRFDWFAWNKSYREDEWFLSFSPAQRWAWVAFLSWANESDWRVRKISFELLAKRIEADAADLRTMIEASVQEGKILDEGETWYVVNGNKHRQKGDTTNSERQKRYREAKKKVTPDEESNGIVTESNVTQPLQSVTNVTVTVPVKTEPKGSHKDSNKAFSPTPFPKRNGNSSVRTNGVKAISEVFQDTQNQGVGNSKDPPTPQELTEQVIDFLKDYDLRDTEDIKRKRIFFLDRITNQQNGLGLDCVIRLFDNLKHKITSQPNIGSPTGLFIHMLQGRPKTIPVTP